MSDNCDWCSNRLNGNIYRSPDYRIGFCSKKCMVERYNTLGIPPELKAPGCLHYIGKIFKFFIFVGVIVLIYFKLISNSNDPNLSNTNNPNSSNSNDQNSVSFSTDTTVVNTTSEEELPLEEEELPLEEEELPLIEENNNSNIFKKRELTIYNNTSEKVFLAYAFYNDSESKWESIGWYDIESNKSISMTLSNKLLRNDAYWYSISESGVEKTGEESFFCINPTKKFDFLFKGLNECTNTYKGFIKQEFTDGKASVYISN